jgi:Skp family chaperone for outer membrane proteins
MPGLRVACFSPQRAFSESADGKAAMARLATLQNEKARAIDERNKALQAREQALERTSPLLSESVRTQRTSELEKLRIDVQRFIEDAQAELMGIRRDAETAFVMKLKPALARVSSSCSTSTTARSRGSIRPSTSPRRSSSSWRSSRSGRRVRQGLQSAA